MNVLIVVDMQNDFVSGALGTPEAQKIVPAVVKRVKEGIRRGEQGPLARPPVLLFESYDRMENRILCVICLNDL